MTGNPKTTGEAAVGLPQFCLEPDATEADRTLAWVNSICFVYLVIGLLSLKPPVPVVHKAPPVAPEAAPMVIEPLASPAQPATSNPAPGQAQASSERPVEESNTVVMVVPDSPAVVFSVPTVGNLLVPLSMAAAPPPKPMENILPIAPSAPEPIRPSAADSALPPLPPRLELVRATGVEGNRPPPPYPEESLRNREEGRVVLLIEVDESGKITSVAVKSSSGHPGLDRATADYVRRHWIFDPAPSARKFEAPISFHIGQEE
jgi:TonB family protein